MVSNVTASEGAPAPASTPTVRVLLREHRDLRLLLAAGLVSMTGDWVLSVGLVYTVYAVTGSTLASAGALMAAFVPQVVTGLFAGVFVDRWSRAGTMVVGNLMLAIGLLPLLWVHDAGDIWVVYAVLAATSVVEVFVATADSAMLPLLVEEEGRMPANALNGQVGQVARLLGGSIGGVVAATGGLGAVVVVDGASFLVAALLVHLIRTPTRPVDPVVDQEVDPDADHQVTGRLAKVAHEWREGAATVSRSRALQVVVAFSLITAVGEGIMGTLFTPFVKDVLEGNAATLGTISSSQAVGGILGGFVAAAAGRRWTARQLFGWGSVVFGLIDLAIFLYPTLYVAAWPAVLGMVLVGFPAAVTIAARTTVLQDNSTDAQRGRIFSLIFAVSALSLSIGATCAGFLGESVGIIPVLAVQGGGYVVAGLMVLALLPGRPGSSAPAEVQAEEVSSVSDPVPEPGR
jgi:Na+/melibiose symporter-like transporter